MAYKVALNALQLGKVKPKKRVEQVGHSSCSEAGQYTHVSSLATASAFLSGGVANKRAQIRARGKVPVFMEGALDQDRDLLY